MSSSISTLGRKEEEGGRGRDACLTDILCTYSRSAYTHALFLFCLLHYTARNQQFIFFSLLLHLCARTARTHTAFTARTCSYLTACTCHYSPLSSHHTCTHYCTHLRLPDINISRALPSSLYTALVVITGAASSSPRRNMTTSSANRHGEHRLPACNNNVGGSVGIPFVGST